MEFFTAPQLRRQAPARVRRAYQRRARRARALRPPPHLTPMRSAPRASIPNRVGTRPPVQRAVRSGGTRSITRRARRAVRRITRSPIVRRLAPIVPGGQAIAAIVRRPPPMAIASPAPPIVRRGAAPFAAPPSSSAMFPQCDGLPPLSGQHIDCIIQAVIDRVIDAQIAAAQGA